jgi:hypothetical protein
MIPERMASLLHRRQTTERQQGLEDFLYKINIDALY